MTESATALASNLPDSFVGLFSTGMAFFRSGCFFMRETNPVPMPTVILASIWHNNKVNPSRELPKKPAPTAPAMKSGPELLQKARSLSACSRVRSLFSYKSAVYLAPAGYPLNHPAIRGNAALPGRLNTGFIKGSNTLPIVYIAPVSRISLETTKNGSSEGNMTFRHRLTPFLPDSITLLGFISRTANKPSNTAQTKYDIPLRLRADMYPPVRALACRAVINLS